MSKRRKPGDIVWLKKNTGFVGESDRYACEIMPEDDPAPCFLCDDSECVEWSTLWTLPNEDGKRYPLYHVSECQMYDERQDES